MRLLFKICMILFCMLLQAVPAFAQGMPMPGMPRPGQFNPQDIDAMLNSMTEEDFNNILQELSKLSPQELEDLEKIGRQVLLDSGIDPDTGKPLENVNPSPIPSTSTPEGAPVKNKPEAKPMVIVQSPEKVALILDTIIKEVSELRQKSSTSDVINRRLNQWHESLNDLLFYIKIINKKEHHNRLATQDFEKLFTILEQCAHSLQLYQNQISSSAKSSQEDDPYILLQIPYTATQQEITQKYNSLKKRYNPKTIKKRLEAQQASKKDIDREVRGATLTFSLIQDAYDQLHDIHTKNSIDKKRAAQNTQELSSVAQHALTQTIDGLSNAIYQHKLLEELQDFLKKFEPEQLVQKEESEKAAAQRGKEQQEHTKTKPALNTTKYDKNYPQQSPYAQNQGFGAGGYGRGGNYPGGNFPGAYDIAAQQPPKEGLKTLGQEGGSAEPKPGAKPESGSDEKAEKKPDEQTKKLMDEVAKKNADEKKKEDSKKIKDLEEELKKYEQKETPPGEPHKETPQVKKAHPPKAKGDSMAIIKKDLAHIKKSMGSKKISRILRRTAKATSPLITEEEITTLQTLELDAFYEHLLAWKAHGINDKAKISPEWERLTTAYTPTLMALNKSIEQERAKAARENKTSPGMQALYQTMTAIIREYDDLSQMFLGKKVIDTPINDPEPLISDSFLQDDA